MGFFVAVSLKAVTDFSRRKYTWFLCFAMWYDFLLLSDELCSLVTENKKANCPRWHWRWYFLFAFVETLSFTNYFEKLLFKEDFFKYLRDIIKISGSSIYSLNFLLEKTLHVFSNLLYLFSNLKFPNIFSKLLFFHIIWLITKCNFWIS